jgi:predicted lipoprotein with Yx(FWY)xxD motif
VIFIHQEGTTLMIKRTGIALIGAIVMVTAAVAQTAPAKVADTSKGKALVDAKGMTLYVFDKDKDAPGKSVCNGTCAENWPVLLASGSDKASGDWTIVARDDGKKMWAYKGRPLYTWKNDKAPGDVDGDGKLNGAWHVATP